MTLGERDHDPNDEIPVPSPMATTVTREELWLFAINWTTILQIWFCCKPMCVLMVL